MNSNELMQKVAEVDPDKYYFIVKTASEIKDSPFKDEILSRLNYLMDKAASIGSKWVQFSHESPKASEEVLTKEASWTQFAQNNPMKAKALGALGGGAAGVAGAALAGIAYNLAGDMYDAARRGITKSRDYKSMLAENPDLKNLDQRQVQKAFSVLHKFNPDFASDPTVAGAFVRRGATFEGDTSMGDTKMLKDLIDSRKNLHDLKKLPNVPQTPDNRLRGAQREMAHMDLEERKDPDSAYNRKRNNDNYWQENKGVGGAVDEFERIMGRRPGGGPVPQRGGGGRRQP